MVRKPFLDKYRRNLEAVVIYPPHFTFRIVFNHFQRIRYQCLVTETPKSSNTKEEGLSLNKVWTLAIKDAKTRFSAALFKLAHQNFRAGCLKFVSFAYEESFPSVKVGSRGSVAPEASTVATHK